MSNMVSDNLKSYCLIFIKITNSKQQKMLLTPQQFLHCYRLLPNSSSVESAAYQGMEANWIPTNEDFFLLFRLYGPESKTFYKTWMLGDLVKVK
jgi:hypothetical protein